MERRTSLAGVLVLTILLIAGVIWWKREGSLAIEDKNAIAPAILVDELEIDRKLVRLVMCESSGDWDKVIMDKNQRLSYGGLMFQFHTFRQQCIKYGLCDKLWEYRDFEGAIKKPEFQILIARRMIADGSFRRHWRFCAKLVE